MGEVKIPTLGEVMTANPATVNVGATVADAEALMKEYQCRHLPVLENDKAVGVVSDRDIALGKSILGKGASQLLVRQVFVEFPYSADPATPLTKVLSDMAELAIGSALVIEGNQLLGIFTSIDAFRVCAEILKRS